MSKNKTNQGLFISRLQTTHSECIIGSLSMVAQEGQPPFVLQQTLQHFALIEERAECARRRNVGEVPMLIMKIPIECTRRPWQVEVRSSVPTPRLRNFLRWGTSYHPRAD
eukprot:GHVU01016970.1.p2 GENE.GHVU01016970.1~~GHVU01016970.1.p2  ORF type:complete len:110 (+),score=2.48 GHVU01016970.1:359-688(+)